MTVIVFFIPWLWMDTQRRLAALCSERWILWLNDGNNVKNKYS